MEYYIKPNTIFFLKETKVLVTQSCPTLQFHRLQLIRLLCPWNSLGKNTGVGCHSLLQKIFPTQALNSGPLHCRQFLYRLNNRSNLEKPFLDSTVPTSCYPLSYFPLTMKYQDCLRLLSPVPHLPLSLIPIKFLPIISYKICSLNDFFMAKSNDELSVQYETDVNESRKSFKT